MKEFTQEKHHMNAGHAAKDSIIQVLLRHMKEFTQENDHLNTI